MAAQGEGIRVVPPQIMDSNDMELHDTDSSHATASSSSLPPTDVSAGVLARRKEARRLRKEPRNKRKEEEVANEAKSLKLAEKLQRKEIRRLKRELKKREEELKASKEQPSQVEVESSSTEDGDDDVSYQVSKTNKKDDKGKGNDNKYGAVSFHYPSMSNHDRRSFINVPTGKLPHFNGTNFVKWKYLMRAYLRSSP